MKTPGEKKKSILASVIEAALLWLLWFATFNALIGLFNLGQMAAFLLSVTVTYVFGLAIYRRKRRSVNVA